MGKVKWYTKYINKEDECNVFIRDRETFDKIQNALHPLDVADELWSVYDPDFKNYFRLKTKYSNVVFIFDAPVRIDENGEVE